LRGLGLLLLIAFVSAGFQLQGLVGSRGILPLAESLKGVAAEYDARRFFLLPTLFWIDAGDATLTAAWALGAACSLSLALGFLPLPSLFAAWALYLSVVVAGAEFFDFQWDFLLLEMAFTGLFLAPLRRLSAARPEPPPPVLRWLQVWLLFRVFFFSGAVKLLSGDPSWGSLKALRWFFQCQPLPPPPAWWAQQWPGIVLSAACLAVLVVELGVPLLLFLGRPLRRLSFLVLLAYQGALLFFANTHFLNLEVMLLSLFLVDDAAWKDSRLLRPLASRFGRPTAPPGVRWAAVPCAFLVLSLTLLQAVADLGYRGRWPEPFLSMSRFNAPLRLVGHYGYTVTSIDTRPQIVVEGTLDGKDWKEYRFRWAPGDLRRMPGFSSPHSPRLEARLWLAAHGKCEDAPWFQQFLGRLATASPPVLDLLAEEPFGGQAPLTVRSRRYDYRFTGLGERWRTGNAWVRVERGEFCPPVSDPDRPKSGNTGNGGGSAAKPHSP
jgi:hypothetical protein